MKRTLIITSLCCLFVFSTYARSGDGWSSSGGGEYIVTEGNPWFMGASPVTWCINYGGEDNFSLSLELSKIEVEKGIKRLADQLKSINNHETNLDYDTILDDEYARKCEISKDSFEQHNNWTQSCTGNSGGLLISDQYIFTEKCNNADLEIILGNINDPKIKTLINEIGEIRFRNLAGVAIRTQYDQKNLRGKGFIYIAADLGKMSYVGQRSIYLRGKTIWNYHNSLPNNTKFPTNIWNTFWNSNPDKTTFKESTTGALQPIIVHEFGHVLGLKHTTTKDVMDVDYPAEVIKNGLVFQGNYIRSANIFSEQNIEENMDRRISFEYHTCAFRQCGELHEILKTEHKFLANLLHFPLYNEEGDFDSDIYSAKLLIVLDTEFKERSRLDSDNLEFYSKDFSSTFGNFHYIQKGTFSVYAINKKTFQYEEKIKLKTTYAFCDFNNQYQRINLRIENRYTIPTVELDPKTGEWKKTPSQNAIQNETLTLLGLRTRDLCGEITDTTGQTHLFELKIDNQNRKYELSFISVGLEGSPYFRFSLDKSHLSNNFKNGLPVPRPEYYFEKIEY